jgi:hypothetical protein
MMTPKKRLQARELSRLRAAKTIAEDRYNIGGVLKRRSAPKKITLPSTPWDKPKPTETKS